ncbi:MAG: hypothetical protein A3K90_04035 [Pelodictyon luteolum]|uniref:Integrase DNA-binding domain-containing protein n=1 Tax=Pelodictyon luteolum TaxID=1100 RepID=A0A165LTV0_PELLU|nr:Arm DNA-binding domain-containing protein [Pelodictyon luteolum]KZK74424.1 MAG: hypothetical protein A3K90_04035 [Pelodictyon luteolum]
MALGQYPQITLANARKRREEARVLLANGQDPGAAKQAAKKAALINEASSFELIAGVWYGKNEAVRSPGHDTTVKNRLI